MFCRLPVPAEPFEVALDEWKGGSLTVVVIAIDEAEATLATIVSRIDQDRVSQPTSMMVTASSAIILHLSLTSLSGKARRLASI